MGDEPANHLGIFEIFVMLSGFKQEDLCIGILGESASDDAAGGTSSGQVSSCTW